MKLLGIDVGGTNIEAGEVSPNGELLSSESWKTPENLNGFVDILKRIKERYPDPSHVGVGIPGLWDEKLQKIRFAPNISFLQDAEVGNIVRSYFPMAKIHNDATVAAFGEGIFGNGRNFNNFLMVTLGTGIGGGFFTNGTVPTGKKGYAWEIGHIKVNSEGIKCGCGAIGCWETEASANALRRKYKEKTGLVLDGEEISKRAKNGEKEALDVFKDIGYWLGVGLASLVNVLDPEAIIIGGGLSLSFELFEETLIRTLEENSYVYRYSRPEVLPALLRKKAGILGAAAFGWKGKG